MARGQKTTLVFFPPTHAPEGVVPLSLTLGKVAWLLKQQLTKEVIELNWTANKCGKSNTWHARATRTNSSGGKERVWLHRLLLGVSHLPSTLIQVDHKDGDGLNNWPANIRMSTQSQNRANSPKLTLKKGATSSFKGVRRKYLKNGSIRWISSIRFKGIDVYLGVFRNSDDAARVYDAAATFVQGPYSRLNFSESPPEDLILSVKSRIEKFMENTRASPK